jgi:hypothetical protein
MFVGLLIFSNEGLEGRISGFFIGVCSCRDVGESEHTAESEEQKRRRAREYLQDMRLNFPGFPVMAKFKFNRPRFLRKSVDVYRGIGDFRMWYHTLYQVRESSLDTGTLTGSDLSK